MLLNCRFVNLNERGYELRKAGSAVRSFYDSIVPGCIRDDGRHRPEYYQAMLQNREFIDRIIEFEIPLIGAWAEELIRNEVRDEALLILSWEYWPMVLGDVKPNHVLYMNCADQGIWFKRLRTRAADRGYKGPVLPDELLATMMSSVKCDPEKLLMRTQKNFSNMWT